jgi:hypothetical protein
MPRAFAIGIASSIALGGRGPRVMAGGSFHWFVFSWCVLPPFCFSDWFI